MSEHTSRNYERFPLARRIEHIVMLSSFIILGLTGLPQKFSTSPLSIAFVGLLGGIENLRLIHHTAAIVMMLGTIWHILVLWLYGLCRADQAEHAAQLAGYQGWLAGSHV